MRSGGRQGVAASLVGRQGLGGRDEKVKRESPGGWVCRTGGSRFGCEDGAQ